MTDLLKTLLWISVLQSCLLPMIRCQFRDNLQYFGMEATTVLFNVLQNPTNWESNLCPGVHANQITRPGYGVDLLTNLVKFVEVLLALATYDRSWVQQYCAHRRERVTKREIIRR